MIVLGGGNTAMDCCRTSRRLGGEEVNVVVRSGFEEMKASPWEKEDAMHEGIPILNYLVPKAFTHEGGQAHRRALREGQAALRRRRAAATLVPTGEPDVHFECDDVLVAIGQENAFPWIERDIGLEFDDWGMPVVDPVTMQSTLPNVFFGGDAAFGPKNIIWAVAHGHEAAISIDQLCQRRRPRRAPAAACNLVSQKMGIHEWSYDNDDLAGSALPGAAASATRSRSTTSRWRSSSASTASSATQEAQRCLNCDVQTVFADAAVHRVRRLRRHLPDGLHHLHARTATEAELRARLNAPAPNLTRTSTSPAPLKTGRVMVKDEDVCLHCGLCAERCPTGAWDMQKFLLDMTRRRVPEPPACRTAQLERARQRFRRQVRQRQRLGLGERQPAVRQVDPAHGRAGRPRNIFPSNIQGLPTWYEVRVSEAG